MGEMLKKQRQKLPFLFGQMLPQSCVDLLNLAIQLPAANNPLLASDQQGKEYSQPPGLSRTKHSRICDGGEMTLHASAQSAMHDHKLWMRVLTIADKRNA